MRRVFVVNKMEIASMLRHGNSPAGFAGSRVMVPCTSILDHTRLT